MTTKDNGGPAFPVPTDMSGGEAFYLATPGMSLRDWFAGQAMGGICAHSDTWGLPDVSEIALKAYRIADAMIAARALTTGENDD
jgi:hypothetical protein